MASRVPKSNSIRISVGTKRLPLISLIGFTKTTVSKEVRTYSRTLKTPAQINAFIKKMKKHVIDKSNLAFKSVCFDIYKRIIVDTPYLTGLSKATWQMGKNKKPRALPIGRDQINKFRRNPLPPIAAEKISLNRSTVPLSSVTYDDRVFILNNTPYLRYLEAGSSKQAPAGFIIQAVRNAIRDFTFDGVIRGREFGLSGKSSKSRRRKKIKPYKRLKPRKPFLIHKELDTQAARRREKKRPKVDANITKSKRPKATPDPIIPQTTIPKPRKPRKSRSKKKPPEKPFVPSLRSAKTKKKGTIKAVTKLKNKVKRVRKLKSRKVVTKNPAKK